MAFGAWVQGTSKDAGSVASSTLAYGSNVTAGNTLIICVRAGGGALQSLSVSDNLNGNWTKDEETFVTGIGTTSSWRFSNTAGGACTITVTNNTSTQTLRFVQDEYQGSFTLDTNGGVAQATGTSTTPSSGNLTTSQTCAILGHITNANGVASNTFTAGSGFTLREALPSTSNSDDCVNTEDEATTQAAGTYAATGTFGTSEQWVAQILAYYNASAAVVTSLSPQVDPAWLILDQYGLTAAFQQQTPLAGAPMTQWSGSGNLDFEASATFTETAYSKPPQVTPAEIVLAQYGFDSVYLTTPNAGAPMVQWSGAGNLDFEASATFTETAYPTPAQVTPAELILAQYGLDNVYLTTVNAGAPMAQWAGSGNLDFEASATFSLGVPSILPPVLPAELILAQYGLDTVYLTTPNAGGTVTNWTGTGSLVFNGSATFTETAYPTPPQVTPAELILQQYGLDSVYLTAPNAGVPMTQWSGSGNLDFEAQGAFYQSAYSVPPQIQVAQLILQQYGVDSTLLVTPNAGAPMVQAAGTGNLDFEASATFTLVTPTPFGPQVLPAQLILQQYGLDVAFQVVNPLPVTVTVGSSLAGLVSPGGKAGLIFYPSLGAYGTGTYGSGLYGTGSGQQYIEQLAQVSPTEQGGQDSV